MNTFAMNPAMRLAVETQAGRGLPDATETLEPGNTLFDAVLGALKAPPAQTRAAAPDAAAPDEPAASGENLPASADPLGILAGPTPAEPPRKAGRDAFDALVARAIPERAPVWGAIGTAGDAAAVPIAVPASVDQPSAGRTEADRDPRAAEARGTEASALPQPDPAARALVAMAVPIPPGSAPEPGAPRPAPDAAASTLAGAVQAPPIQAAPDARMRATVLRQETHFAPVMPRSIRLPSGDTAAAGGAATFDPSGFIPATGPVAAAPTGPVAAPSVAAVPEFARPERGAFAAPAGALAHGVSADVSPIAAQVEGAVTPAPPETVADAPARSTPTAAGASAAVETVFRGETVFRSETGFRSASAQPGTAPIPPASQAPASAPALRSEAVTEQVISVAPVLVPPATAASGRAPAASLVSDAPLTDDPVTPVASIVGAEPAGRIPHAEDRDAFDRAKVLPAASSGPVVALPAAAAKTAAPALPSAPALPGASALSAAASDLPAAPTPSAAAPGLPATAPALSEAAPGLPAADPTGSAAVAVVAAPAAIPTVPVRTSEPVHASANASEIAPHPTVVAPSGKAEVAPSEHDAAGSRPDFVVAQGATAADAPMLSSLSPVSSASATSDGSFGSPAAQIAEAVATEAQRVAAAQPGASTGLVAADGPLRILTLQLRPMDLGNVVVRMRLRGSQLEMSLHASREDTAELLRKDGALLSALLRDAGYQPDAVTIGAPMPEATSGHGPASGQTFQPGSGGQNPARDMSDQPARRQPETGAERTTDARERTHETNSAGPDRNGVYL